MAVETVPCSFVELTISCQHLINADVLSKSDPCCIVSLKDPRTNLWREIGRTEVIMDNLNPEFAKKISLTYLFEERQMLRFDVYDIDSNSQNMADHDFLGSLEAPLGEIVSTSGVTSFVKPLVTPGRSNSGKIKIVVEEIQAAREHYSMKWSAQNLPSSFFSSSRGFFFEIHKAMENNPLTLVYRSTVISGKKNVEWPQFQLNAYTLCSFDVDKNLQLTVFKHKSNGSHSKIGACNATVRGLLNGQAMYKLPGSGATFQLLSISKDSHSTFMDFVKTGGVQLNCFVAVDFTSSNGVPTNPSSLHFINPHGFNQYQLALKSVLDIIQDYDSDKMFPALGFGAQIPPNWAVSHEFFLNFHPTNPYCEGVDGVMRAYANAITNVRLFGPTNFAPVINHVSRFAAVHNDGQNYFILLIITDGVISDMAATTDAIVAASSMPVSIIIVGVGSADFGAMEVLDADDKPLVDSQRRQMQRDIVQFVPFSSIVQKAGNNMAAAQVELAREVLAEIPQQFLSFMKKIGKTPEQIAADQRNKQAHA